ncbi:UNVERIFIED_CONTAM: hypothetical protein GTU68_057734 [Idotea baltica]|nr:hypothetical protein [Idotea baltica]
MFVILNKFASPGLTKGKIFELVQLDFKILALVIKLVSFYKLETEHSKVLLYYARNNLDDFNQHNSSFVILHALLGRKVNISELHDLMVVIREMSITSPNLNMLDQARRTYLNYWLNYPIRKKHLQEILTFYLQNISYHIPEGRMSSALMLSEIIQKFPRNVFDQSVEVTIWFKLTEQLIKEDSKEHKGMLQKLLKSLFFKSVRKNLFIVNCLKLLQDDLMKDAVQNAVSIHMGAQSLLAMLDVQILDLPPSVFQTLLPEVAELLHPGRYQVAAEADDVDRQAHCLDLALTSLLDLFMQLMDIYFNKKNLSSWSECVGEDVWRFIQDHLLYPNLKVRLNSGLILGRLFAMYPSDMENTPSLASTSQMAGSLVMDLCEQLNTECPIESPMLSELGLVVVRNLIYLIRQSKKVPLKLGRSNKLTLTQKKSVNFEEADVPEDEDIPEDEESSAKSRKGRHTDSTFLEEAPSKPDRNPYFNEAYWVLHRVGVMAYDELRKKGRDSTFRRECLLNLIAAVVVILDADFESATNIISFILHHLTRELSDKRLPQTLYIRTKEVSNLVRERIGVEKYSEEVLRVQGTLGRKRMERKTKTRQMILSNPTIAVNKRAKKQEAKKQSKKRKLAELKLKPVGNKRLKHMAIIKA